MGKASRDKGARGERAVATIYRERGIDCDRVPNSGGLATKGDLLGVPGCHVEVKSAAALRILEWLRQCEAEAPAGQIPALHFRQCLRSGSTGWYVAVPLGDFIDLLTRVEE